MMRVFLFCLLFALAGPSSAEAADRFVSVIEDLPLMAGLNENENAAVTFDSAGGRIAEAEARGNLDPGKVQAFYAGVLPQLGWTAMDPGAYRREREQLRVLIEADGDGGVVASFSVSPLNR